MSRLQLLGLRLAVALLLLGAAAVAAGHLAVAALTRADVAASIDVAGARTQAGIDIATGLSRLGDTLTVVVISALAALGLLRVRQRAAAILVVAAALGATVLDETVKYLVARPRPQVALPVGGLSTYSFPSGHATHAAAVYLALALAMAASLGSRRQAWLAVAAAAALAVLVGASRIYLGVHYPSDVAAGLLLGAGWTYVCWRLLRALPADG